MFYRECSKYLLNKPSLNYIIIYFDILKLDKSFLDGIENEERSRNIAKSIVSLDKSLGLIVIIEGVENKEQAELMKQFGCDLVQGFYFARPMPAKNFVDLLQE